MELYSSINSIPLVGKSYRSKLEKLNIYTVRDLLFHVPSRYEDYRKIEKISDLMYGDTVSVQGEVMGVKNNYTRYKKNFQSAAVSDGSGNIQLIWFNQPFILKNLKKGDRLSVSGKVGEFGNHLSFISPDYELMRGNKTVHTAKIIPIYPETAGVSSKWLRSRINHILDRLILEENLPKDAIKTNDLIPLDTAIRYIHTPQNLDQIKEARKRLAFDEILDIQLQSYSRKRKWKQQLPTHKLKIDNDLIKIYNKILPFDLTESQTRSIHEIFEDLKKGSPMNRLLEGDVGSGKTVVAAAGVFASHRNGYKSILMAPTQILAEQHFRTMSELFARHQIRTQLIVSGTKNIDKDADIFIGTHALIHNKVDFNEVAYVIIDEQQRFGVEQREHLIKTSNKGKIAPHILTMTATPIPRTIALTFYGDLDLSTLDELPSGRKPITTWLVPEKKREGAYDWIKEQITKDNVQVFVVCPIIEESDHESMQQVKAATVEYERLQKIFFDHQLGLLHGKLKNNEKTNILNDFKNGGLDILVSTPVVEVGIDIPNATIMLIEGAERFGLAQLHQLRGRVGRGEKSSYCLLFSESKSSKTKQRLMAMTKMTSGFELAELDLQLRGPGEIFGIRQHGFPELKVATWQDKELIRKTKKTAEELINNSEKYSKILKRRFERIQNLN